MNSISQVMVHYEWANRAQGRFMKSWLTLLPQTTRFHRNTYRNKKLEATEADECIVIDDNEYSKDIGIPRLIKTKTKRGARTQKGSPIRLHCPRTKN